jgi:hypothetical protein
MVAVPAEDGIIDAVTVSLADATLVAPKLLDAALPAPTQEVALANAASAQVVALADAASAEEVALADAALTASEEVALADAAMAAPVQEIDLFDEVMTAADEEEVAPANAASAQVVALADAALMASEEVALADAASAEEVAPANAASAQVVALTDAALTASEEVVLADAAMAAPVQEIDLFDEVMTAADEEEIPDAALAAADKEVALLDAALVAPEQEVELLGAALIVADRVLAPAALMMEKMLEGSPGFREGALLFMQPDDINNVNNLSQANTTKFQRMLSDSKKRYRAIELQSTWVLGVHVQQDRKVSFLMQRILNNASVTWRPEKRVKHFIGVMNYNQFNSA